VLVSSVAPGPSSPPFCVLCRLRSVSSITSILSPPSPLFESSVAPALYCSYIFYILLQSCCLAFALFSCGVNPLQVRLFSVPAASVLVGIRPLPALPTLLPSYPLCFSLRVFERSRSHRFLQPVLRSALLSLFGFLAPNFLTHS
jgi:hypothetical protein